MATSAPVGVERAPGLDGATLVEAFALTAAAFADKPALRVAGSEEAITWGDYAARVRRLAAGLASLGVGHGDTVGMMLVNRPEFHLVDTAALHLRAVPFSVYNSSAPEQIEYLFSNAQNRVVITERAFEEIIRAVDAPGVEHIIVLEDGLPEADAFEEPNVQPDDIATLIYTSGTTGPPKGVQLTHAGLIFALNGAASVLVARPGGRVVSYLPCAH
ncbi:MAG TPA: AMP-binding protein, partial [Solirubrobacteraceae bacterium]